jgi:FixJ family two-component response regulator
MDVGKHRVFIVDDDSSVRIGLSRLLHSAGYDAEAFSSATAFLQRLPYDGMACLILDIRMPNISGIELHKQLTEKGTNLPVIFLTAHGDLPMGVQAMKRGAEDFLQKPVDESILLDVVRKALTRYKSSRNDQLINRKVKSTLDALTPRELETLQYILGGATNSKIAEFLHISEKTVKVHRGKIMQKMGASSAAELGWICSSTKITAKNV